jgi:REP element-mobilizing transposase RayT
VETGVYHVASRGNARQAIFRDPIDYSTFLKMLAPIAAELGWVCSAFCLMPNHYHLLLEVPEGSLPRGMHLERLPATFDSHESYRAFVEGGTARLQPA